MTKIALVSGCDANYYPLLREWIHSVRRFEESREMDICILDAGLTLEQVKTLEPLVQCIKRPEWPCPLPALKVRGREFLKACVCRPFLPQIFPGYDVYFWMDADTWVQDWSGPEMFLQGAQSKRVTLTAQVDRSYPRGGARIKWLGRIPAKVRGFYFSNALKSFDFATAKDLLSYHVLLAGAFALHKDAPHWARWQELVVQAMTKGKVFTAEQLCLGKICYQEGFGYEILPAYTHWLCEHKPLWDEKEQAFVEPFLPHQKIGILHISGWDEMRLDRAVNTEFKTLGGGSVQRSYRYSSFNGETGKAL